MKIKREMMILTLVLMMLITMFNTGCLTDNNKDKYKDVFYSDVVKLVNYSLNLEKNKDDKIIKATVKGYIANMLDRMIKVNITVTFYSKTDTVLDRKSYEIYSLRAKGEIASMTDFTINYDGENVSYVDHIKMHAFEIT